MIGISKEPSSFNLALILPTFFLVFGANSSMIDVGKFDRVSTESGNMMTSVRQSRSVFQCALTCLSERCCPVQPCCSAFCQSVTSSVCYLNMTSESLEQPLLDTFHGYKCFVREKPACPVDLGYLLARGQCVKLYQELKIPGKARSQCEEDGGHLYYYKNLTTDEPVINELRDFMNASSFYLWVGADKMTTSDYQWHDGCPLPDSDPVWYPGQPNDSGERCVSIDTAGNMRLHDNICSNMYSFVCQIDV